MTDAADGGGPGPARDAEAVEVSIRLSVEQHTAATREAQRRGLTLDELVAAGLRLQVMPQSTHADEAVELHPHLGGDPLARLPLPARLGVRLLGEVVRRRWTLGQPRHRIGAGLVCNGRLRLAGPGTIELGSGINAWARSGRNVLTTFREDAVIRIGNNVRLNGAGIQAATSVTVGDDAILGTCTIIDTDHHAVSPEARREAAVRAGPVTIGRNAWIAGAAILKGVNVGENSVVGLGSVVTADVPANVVVAGNPARVVRRLSD